MSPSETIRAMLDERGIEWRGVTNRDTYWYGQDRTFYQFAEYNNGTTSFTTCQWNLTPKQVLTTPIAATVGVENRDTMELWPEWEEVLFANVSDEVAQDNLNECVHKLLEEAVTLGAGTCHYDPDDTGFTWWDENDVEHHEEYSASDECGSASCDKCGYTMMVGDEGWFDGWDEITEWTEEDGSEHKGYILKPRFKFCPNCGKRIEEEAE